MAITAKRRIGILTSGGDCPGLNATIRGVILTCEQHFGADNVEFIGISNGYHGLIHNECKPIGNYDFDTLLTQGGTFLGTKRTPFKKMQEIESDGIDKIAKMKYTYNKLGLDCILALGGKGSHKNANLLSEEGLNIIGLPKTIDNDIWGTDVTFGFHTAVEIGTDVIDRIHTTAKSHSRAMVVEIMGNRTGWLTLYSGIAGGCDVILIPEIPYNESKVVQAVQKCVTAGKCPVIAVAEGAMDVSESQMKKKERARIREVRGETTVTNRIVNLIQNNIGIESRAVVPGHFLRGGTPSAYERILSTQFGARAAMLIREEKYGYSVAKIGNIITENKLSEMAGKSKEVALNGEVVQTARDIGISFGN